METELFHVHYVKQNLCMTDILERAQIHHHMCECYMNNTLTKVCFIKLAENCLTECF